MSLLISGNVSVRAGTGPLPIEQGGTGQTTAPAALNALLPPQGTSGQALVTDGSTASWENTGTVTSVGITTSGPNAGALSVDETPITDSGTIVVTPNLFTDTTPGVVPPSGGGVINFLRADGTWAVPAGGGGGTGTVTSVAVSGANGISVAGSPITTNGTIALGLGAITPTSISTSGSVTASSFVGPVTGASSLNVLKAGDTMTGLLTINSGGGVSSSTSNLSILNGAGQGLIVVPKATNGALGAQVKDGDIVLSGQSGTQGSPVSGLMIGPWNFGTNGIRIDANGYVSVGIPYQPTFSFAVGMGLTAHGNGTGAFGIASLQSVASDVTNTASGFYSNVSTDNVAFTISNLAQFYTSGGSKGANSTITSNYGYYLGSGLTSGVSNYGFYGDVAAATGRWNFYANGTASNYLAGNLLLGYANTITNFIGPPPVIPKLQITGLTTDASSISHSKFANDTSGSSIFMNKSRGTTAGAFALVSLNDSIGNISWQGSDNTQLREASRITTVVDATPVAGSIPGAILFYTNPAGSNAVTERMRISSSGFVGIGKTNPAQALDITGNIVASGTVTATTFVGNVTGSSSLNVLKAGDTMTGKLNLPNNGLGVGTTQLVVAGGNVGIGVSPAAGAKLHIKGLSDIFRLETTATVGECFFSFYSSAGRTGWMGYGSSTTDDFFITNEEAANIILATNDTERIRISPTGAIGLSGANYGTSGQVITSTGPTTPPTWQTPTGGGGGGGETFTPFLLMGA